MADDTKKPYTVVQEGKDGTPIYVNGQLVRKNDTVWLTDLEAKYHIGFSIEPGAGNIPEPATPVGEHRESGADVIAESRPMKDVEVHEEEDRTAKRPKRSTTHKG